MTAKNPETNVSAVASLDRFIDRPEPRSARRHMVAIDSEAYDYITDLAIELDTSRGKVVNALVQNFDAARKGA